MGWRRATDAVKARMRTSFSWHQEQHLLCQEENVGMVVSPLQLAALAEAEWVGLVDAISTSAPLSLVVTEVIVAVL